MNSKPGKRFRLRLYERLFAMFRWPSLLIAILTAGLWWIAPNYPLLAAGQGLLPVVPVICFVLFLAGLVGPALSYVQCHASYLLISTPFYRLSVGYSRIDMITAVNFAQAYPLSRQGWSQRRFLEPLYYEPTGQLTVVAVWVREYPLPLRWLKLWFTDYMFTPDSPGFLFMVNDWMALSHQIEDYRDAWRERRARRHTKDISPAHRILKKGDKQR